MLFFVFLAVNIQKNKYCKQIYHKRIILAHYLLCITQNTIRRFFMKMKKLILIITLLLICSMGLVLAEDTGPTPESNQQALDMVWVLITGFLVFFMQAGFAMVEIGFTRAKNAGNILMKNLMDFCIGAIAFWAIGYAVMFGNNLLGGLFGYDAAKSFLGGTNGTTFMHWMFQVVFAATAATIVSGAMAERTKFISYLIYSFFISLIIYPVVGHWIWGGGWLSALGFHDFAGSTVVHSVGGWAAMIGSLLLGARNGKYLKINNKIVVKSIPGHNLTIAGLGVFILWFGWYGFNPGSTLSAGTGAIATIAVTTTLAAAAGAIVALFFTWIWFKRPDPSMSLNGALAGLVAITAGCAYVSPLSAIIIGALAGILVVLSVEFFDKVLYIDDPVGAISVHGVNGAFGTIAVGLFGEKAYGATMDGLFAGGGFSFLGIQFIGVISVLAWVGITAFILFGVIKKTVGLRVKPSEELRGLDISEHGIDAYHGFQVFNNQ